MTDLANTLSRLERLRDLARELAPIRYQGSDRAKELGQAIAELYGSVEDEYRELTGEKKVTLKHDGGSTLSYSNYFEAGWLSVWTIHMSEGMNELDKIIGKVRSAVEDGRTRRPHGDDLVWSMLHPEVSKLARSRFDATHFADAVEAAAKGLGGAVRALVMQAGGDELDGVPLMQHAFSPKKPIIVLADLGTVSGRDMQRGYMEMFSGAMFALRNPKAHGIVVIDPVRAIHLLFVISTLWGTLDARPR